MHGLEAHAHREVALSVHDNCKIECSAGKK